MKRYDEVVIPAPSATAVAPRADDSKAEAKAEQRRPAAPARWRLALGRARRPAKRAAWLFFTLLSVAALPRVVELVLPRVVDMLAREELGLRAAVGRIDIDVANLRVLVRDLVFAPAEGGPSVATIESVEIDLAPSRIREGIVVERATIDGVTIRAHRSADGRIDVVHAIANAPARKKPSSSETARFLVEEATVKRIRVIVTDEKAPAPATPGERRDRHELSLEILAHDVGTIRRREGPTPPGRFWLTGTGDVAETLHVEGETDLATAKDVDQSIDARILLAGLDPGALTASLPGAAANARKIGFSTRLHLRLARLVAGIEQVTVRVEDAAYTLDGVPGFGMAVAEAVFEVEPGQRTVWRKAYFEKANLPFERRADGALTFLGFTFARQTPTPPPVDASSAIATDTSGTALRVLADIEAALRDGGGAPSREAGNGAANREKARRDSSFPEVSLDDLVARGCEVHFRDKMTPGEPEVVFKDVDAEVHSPRWMDGRVIGGRVVGRAPGLASDIEVLVNGAEAKRTFSLTVGVKIGGLDASLIDPYLAASSRSFGLSHGRIEATVSAYVEKESDEDLRACVELRDVALVDDQGPRLRVPRLAIELAARSSGGASAIDVESVTGEAWVSARRGEDGALTIAGFAPAAQDPKRPHGTPRPAREPAGSIRLRDLALDLGARYDDDPARVGTDLTLRVTARDLLLGAKPEVGIISVRGSAPGLARSIAIDGRLLPSAVTPAAALTLDVALESALARALLAPAGWRPLLDDRRVTLRASFAQDLAVPSARATVARVTSLAVTDSGGVGASVDQLEVRVVQGADPALLEVPLVSMSGPRLSVEQTPSGLLIGRTLLRDSNAPRKPARSAPPPEGRPKRNLTTVRVERIKVDRGEVAILGTFAPVVVVQGLRLRAGPLELGPGAARPLELDLSASALPFAQSLQVTGSIAQPLEAPSATLALRATGVDLEPVRVAMPETIARATVRRGSLRASITSRLAPLREGGFSGVVALRDVTFRDDGDRELLGLGEARARVLRFDDETSDLDIASLELDRLHVEVGRDRGGHVEVLGVVTAQEALALTDEERRQRAVEGEEGGARGAKNGTKAPPAPPRGAPPAKRTPRISIDHLAVADGHVRFVDRGALNDDGTPIVFDAVSLDGTADRIVAGGPPGLQPVTRFELEVRFDDGMRAAADGVVTLHPEGSVDGRIEGELRGLSLVKVSRYAENAANVSLERGFLDGAARIDLLHNNAEGEVEIFARRLRIRRQSDNPLAALGSQLGTGLVLSFLTDWEGDTAITIPIRRGQVSTRGVVADVLQELIISTLGQPVKLLIRPLEGASGTSARDWRRWIFGPRLEAPVEKDALFAPGDSRLTAAGARAVATASELMTRGGRQVRVRAECGPGDRARAFRAAALTPAEVRSIMTSLESERRVREDERRDLAAAERRALDGRDLEAATATRKRLLEAGAALARIDRSLADLAERAELEATPNTIRSRAEESLRRLCARRADTIRKALAAAGVEERLTRVRPSRVHNASDTPLEPGGGGRVTIEVVP